MTSFMRWVLGPYRIGTVDDLNEDGLLRIVRMRRRQLGQMTMALDTESAKRRIPDGEYQISQKIDGEFTMLIYRDGEACILNPGKTLRAGAPFLDEAISHLKNAGVKKALIGGEFYVQRTEGGKLIHPVKTVIGENSAAVLKQYDAWVDEGGHEGVVARSPNAGVFKVKPKHNLDLAVIGFTESTDDRQGMLHDMLCWNGMRMKRAGKACAVFRSAR